MPCTTPSPQKLAPRQLPALAQNYNLELQRLVTIQPRCPFLVIHPVLILRHNFIGGIDGSEHHLFAPHSITDQDVHQLRFTGAQMTDLAASSVVRGCGEEG
eukprot:scaffold429_cov269-Pinguiococcus_pyrenoidosus.AAC.7